MAVGDGSGGGRNGDEESGGGGTGDEESDGGGTGDEESGGGTTGDEELGGGGTGDEELGGGGTGDEKLGGGDDFDASNEYESRAFALRERAHSAASRFDPPSDPPASDQALEFARDGVGAAAALYIEARSEDSWVYFDEDAFDALEDALNTFLDCFAACHGVERESAVTVRTAAETLLDTHDAVDTAAVLTDVDPTWRS